MQDAAEAVGEQAPLDGHDVPASRWLGRSIPRVEDPRLLTGQGRFVGDVALPNMVHAAFVRSPHARARIRGLDVEPARAVPGVVAVLTARDLPHAPLVDTVAIEGLVKTPQPALAADGVHFEGEALAIVLASSRYAAEDGAELVEVDYEPLEPVLDVERAIDAEPLQPGLDSNVLYRRVKRFGDVDAAFAEAAHVFRGTFHSNRFVAAPIETRGCVADYAPAAGELTVWSSTQGPHLLRRRLTLTTGVPEHRIRVIAPDVGGGFGQKIPAHPEEVAVALASRHLGLPVKWIEDRNENLAAAPHAKEQVIALELAVSEAGDFLGMRARVLGDAGAYSHNSASALIEPYLSAGLMPGVYAIRHYECEIVAALTSKSPVSPYRGVGWTAGHTARELLIDRAARALDADPADLRRRNMVPTDAFPYRSCTGMVYDSGSFQESLDKALAAIDYERLREQQRRDRSASGRLLGIGISPYVEPTGWGSEGSLQSDWSFASNDSVRLSIEPSGQVVAAVGSPTQGQGHHTTLAQLIADELGVHPDEISIVNADTRATPVSTSGTRASRTAVVVGGALTIGARELREKLLRMAGHLLEAAPEDLEIAGGRIRVRGVPTREVSVRDVAEAAYYSPALRAVEPDPTLSVTRFHDPKATYSNGCIAAVVEIDGETGGVEVRTIAAVEDCGTILNPAIVEGQVAGAVAQGVGGALLEGMEYGPDGTLVTQSFMDYLMPTATDVPELVIAHCVSPSPFTVGGVKGMGESGVISTPAAVANAVADALAHLDFEVESLPIKPETIVSAVHTDRH